MVAKSDYMPKVGDLVVLLSGSPPLTVLSVHDGDVEIGWFKGKELFGGVFPAAALMPWVTN